MSVHPFICALSCSFHVLSSCFPDVISAQDPLWLPHSPSTSTSLFTWRAPACPSRAYSVSPPAPAGRAPSPPLLPHHSPTTLLPLAPVLHVMCLWIYTVLSLTSSEGMGLIAGPLCGLTQGPDLVDVGRVEVRVTGPGWVPWVAPSSAGRQPRREIQACLPGEAPPSSA